MFNSRVSIKYWELIFIACPSTDSIDIKYFLLLSYRVNIFQQVSFIGEFALNMI